MNFKLLIASAAITFVTAPTHAALITSTPIALSIGDHFTNGKGLIIRKKEPDSWSSSSKVFQVKDNSDLIFKFSFYNYDKDHNGFAQSLKVTLFNLDDSSKKTSFTFKNNRLSPVKPFTGEHTFSDLVAGNRYQFQFAGYTPKFEGRFQYRAEAVEVIPAVPEPETYALMGLGLLGLIAARRNKAKKYV